MGGIVMSHPDAPRNREDAWSDTRRNARDAWDGAALEGLKAHARALGRRAVRQMWPAATAHEGAAALPKSFAPEQAGKRRTRRLGPHAPEIRGDADLPADWCARLPVVSETSRRPCLRGFGRFCAQADVALAAVTDAVLAEFAAHSAANHTSAQPHRTPPPPRRLPGTAASARGCPAGRKCCWPRPAGASPTP